MFPFIKKTRTISCRVHGETFTDQFSNYSVGQLYKNYTQGLPVAGSVSSPVYDNHREFVYNPINCFGIDIADLVKFVDKHKDNVNSQKANLQNIIQHYKKGSPAEVVSQKNVNQSVDQPNS